MRWALMYPDAYEVGLPNQGVQILYEVLNEAERVLAERTYAVWPDLEAVMRREGIPQFTVDSHRPVRAFDVLGVSFATELGYTNLLTALDLAGIPLHASDRTDADPLVLAGGHAAFNPEPVADFVDAAVLGDGEQAVLAITEVLREHKAEGSPGGRDRAPPEAGRVRLGLRPGVLRRQLLRGRHPRRGRAEPARRPRARPQAHPDGPRLLALPAQPVGAAGRDRARAVLGGDLPRLHPRLPVLPGRDDHPAGARALDHHHRRHGGERRPQVRLRRGRPAVAVQRRPHRDRRRGDRARRPLRGLQRLPSACRARGWTPSTSPSPTSSRATGGARD